MVVKKQQLYEKFSVLIALIENLDVLGYITRNILLFANCCCFFDSSCRLFGGIGVFIGVTHE